jgi:mRNA interferase RelE/StbE
MTNVELTERAINDLEIIERSNPQVYKRVMMKLQSLAVDYKIGKPLVGPLKGKWSLRVGDYRIIYEFITSTVFVLTINHRREVYR